MGYLHDAIMESNELENKSMFSPKIPKHKVCSAEKIAEKTKVEESTQPKDKVEIKKTIKEELVDIEEYLPETAYIEESMKSQMNESVTELPDRYAKGRPGSPEYDANENRRKREAMYRKYANIDEDFEITEDNINQRAFDKTCTMQNCDGNRLKAELLKQPYTGLEKYSED